jgi:hypothetical protein
MFTSGVLAIFEDIFVLGFIVVIMLRMSWPLALLTLAVIPASCMRPLFRKHVRQSYRRQRAATAKINTFTQEYVSGMSVVQLFNREPRAFRDFSASTMRTSSPGPTPSSPTRCTTRWWSCSAPSPSLWCCGTAAWPCCATNAFFARVARHASRARSGSVRSGHAGHAHRVHPVCAAVLPAHHGPQRQVQHPAGRHGRRRAHLQAAGHAAGDCLHCRAGGRQPQRPHRVPRRLVHLPAAQRRTTTSSGCFEGAGLQPRRSDTTPMGL